MPGYHLPLFAAAATGIWQRHGLDVELVEPFPGPDNAKAVAAGRYHACLTSVAHFLRAKRDDPDLRAKFIFMVARRTHLAAFCIADRPAAHGRPIEQIADLASASFLGEPNSPFVREYIALLRSLRLNPGPGVPRTYDQQFDALAAGEGDVGIDFLDLRARFEAAVAPGQRVRALPFYEGGIDVYGSGLVAGVDWLESRPEAARRLTEALRDALFATREEPAIGIDGLCRRYPQTDPARALAGWSAGARLIFDGDVGAMDAETWRRTIDHHALASGAPRLDVASVFDDSFVSARIAAASAAGVPQ